MLVIFMALVVATAMRLSPGTVQQCRLMVQKLSKFVAAHQIVVSISEGASWCLCSFLCLCF